MILFSDPSSASPSLGRVNVHSERKIHFTLFVTTKPSDGATVDKLSSSLEELGAVKFLGVRPRFRFDPLGDSSAFFCKFKACAFLAASVGVIPEDCWLVVTELCPKYALFKIDLINKLCNATKKIKSDSK